MGTVVSPLSRTALLSSALLSTFLHKILNKGFCGQNQKSVKPLTWIMLMVLSKIKLLRLFFFFFLKLLRLLKNILKYTLDFPFPQYSFPESDVLENQILEGVIEW